MSIVLTKGKYYWLANEDIKPILVVISDVLPNGNLLVHKAGQQDSDYGYITTKEDLLPLLEIGEAKHRASIIDKRPYNIKTASVNYNYSI